MTTRRELLQAAAGLGIGVMTTGGFARVSFAQAKNLSYFTWSGYEAKNLHQAYSDKYGKEPDAAFFADEEEALNKVRGGFSPDLIHPCYNTVGRFRDAGVIQPIDVSKLKNWPTVFPTLKEVGGIQADDGKFWIVPFDWGTSSVIYRPDLANVTEESWRILTDPQFKGKISFLDSPDNVAAIAGLLVGAEKVMDLSDEEMKQAEEELRKLHANVRFYWSDQAQLEQALASGEVVAAWGWMSSVNNLKKQGIDVKYMQPKEGVMTWVCGLVRGKAGGADEAAVYDFIDAMLDPQSGQVVIQDFGYGHANAESFKAASPESVKALGFDDPAAFLKTGHFFEAVPPEKRQKLVEMWQKIKAGG
jgi:spermidine/putrescine-binding protein